MQYELLIPISDRKLIYLSVVRLFLVVYSWMTPKHLCDTKCYFPHSTINILPQNTRRKQADQLLKVFNHRSHRRYPEICCLNMIAPKSKCSISLSLKDKRAYYLLDEVLNPVLEIKPGYWIGSELLKLQLSQRAGVSFPPGTLSSFISGNGTVACAISFYSTLYLDCVPITNQTLK